MSNCGFPGLSRLRLPGTKPTRAGEWLQDRAYKLTRQRSTTLPSLRRVQGNALINSTQALNCSDISSTLVQGTYTCHAAVFVSASTSNAASPPSHGLTGGAIGGIVVGIIVALALLATGLLVIYRRQQRAGRRPPAQQEHSRRVEDPVHEVETEQRRRDPAEKDGNAIFEVPDKWPDRGELPGSQSQPNGGGPGKRYELS